MTTPHIAALRNLRIGVAMDLQNLDDGEAKLAALDAAIAALDHPQQPSGWLPIASAPRDGSMILLGREPSKDDEDDEGVSVPGYWQEGWEDSIDDMGCDSGFVDSQYQIFSGGRSFGSESHRCAANQPAVWQPLPIAPSASQPSRPYGGDPAEPRDDSDRGEQREGGDAKRIAELVLSAVKNRSDKDWTLMHLDLSEAAELARAMTRGSNAS